MKYKVPFVFTSDDLARLSVDQTLCVAMAAAAVAGFRVYPICLLGPQRVNGFLSIYFWSHVSYRLLRQYCRRLTKLRQAVNILCWINHVIEVSKQVHLYILSTY